MIKFKGEKFVPTKNVNEDEKVLVFTSFFYYFIATTKWHKKVVFSNVFFSVSAQEMTWNEVEKSFIDSKTINVVMNGSNVFLGERRKILKIFSIVSIFWGVKLDWKKIIKKVFHFSCAANVVHREKRDRKVSQKKVLALIKCSRRRRTRKKVFIPQKQIHLADDEKEKRKEMKMIENWKVFNENLWSLNPKSDDTLNQFSSSLSIFIHLQLCLSLLQDQNFFLLH